MKHLLFAMLLLCSFSKINAQLILQKVGSSLTHKTALNSSIEIKVPTRTYKEACDCHHVYHGMLKKIEKDSVSLQLVSDVRTYVDAKGINKQVTTKYGNNTTDTKIALYKAISITQISRTREDLDKIGVIMMLGVGVQNLVISPFFNDKTRNTLDKISWGMFSAGLVMALLPNKKHYYLSQPKSNDKVLWQRK